MGIVSAYVVTLMAAHFLETRPYIGLDVLHQMTQVNGAISVRERTGYEDGALVGIHGFLMAIVIETAPWRALWAAIMPYPVDL